MFSIDITDDVHAAAQTAPIGAVLVAVKNDSSVMYDWQSSRPDVTGALLTKTNRGFEWINERGGILRLRESGTYDWLPRL